MTEETEIAEPNTEVQEPQIESQESVEEQPKVDSQAENWRKANEILNQQKKEIEELKMRLQEVAKAPPVEEEDEFASLDPEDYLTVSNAKKLAERLAEKKAKQIVVEEIQKHNQQQNIALDEQRARSRYEDYDYVVENYAIPLIKSDPALAYKIQNSPNPAETAYKLGKLSDKYEESVKPQTSQKAEKIIKNNSRPVSSAAAGSPLKSQADQFSKMSKSEIWAMSEKFARGA